MDPNANLEEQLRRARLLADDGAFGVTGRENAARLAELVEALDGWFKGGGFLPDTWRRP